MKRLIVLIVTCFMAGQMTGQRLLAFYYPKNLSDNLKNAYLTRIIWEGKTIDDYTEIIEIYNTWRKNYPETVDQAYFGTSAALLGITFLWVLNSLFLKESEKILNTP